MRGWPWGPKGPRQSTQLNRANIHAPYPFPLPLNQQGAMDMDDEEEIAAILLRLQDTQLQSAPSADVSAAGAADKDSAVAGRRYGTRTAAGLKVGRRYTDLLGE